MPKLAKVLIFRQKNRLKQAWACHTKTNSEISKPTNYKKEELRIHPPNMKKSNICPMQEWNNYFNRRKPL